VYYVGSRDDWQVTEMAPRNAAATATAAATIEQLETLPEDECHYEIIRGELRDVPPAGFEHSNIAGNVLTHVNRFVRRNQLGRVASEAAGFVLARDPDILLSPDVSFVANDRLPPPAERAGFLQLAPDLVVEVMSPNDTVTEVAEKVSIYLQAGVRLIWVVLPKQPLVHVYANDREITILHATDTLDGGDVLPGFSLAVADIFN
jgi:Uma2 family endonuclease